MTAARARAARLLVGVMVGCVVFSTALFGYAAFSRDKELHRQAGKRIDAALDVMTENTLRIFQTSELLLNSIALLIRDLGDEDLRARASEFHEALRRLGHMVPEVQSLWVFDREGVPLATDFVHPIPTMSVKDRDFYVALRNQGDITHIGEVLVPKLPGGDLFFAVARRRAAKDGSFNGLIDVSLMPRTFSASFARLVDEEGLQYRTVRADGVILASFPPDHTDPSHLLSMTAWLPGTLPTGERGQLRAVGTDGIDRLIAYRRVSNHPVYVFVSMETASIWREWLSDMREHLIFGVPATLLILIALAVALHRTRQSFFEAERRVVAETALRRAQRLEAIGQLTGGIAHDFNNLLMVIQASAERLRAAASDARHHRSLQLIETAVNRGATLTRQLLTFSRGQALAADVLDVADHLVHFQEVLRRSLRGDIRSSMEIDGQPCRVKVDPGEFELALLNLAVNARDAMPQGGALTVRVQSVTLRGDADTDGLSGPFVAVSMTDTGAGISADALPHVFDPFFTTKEVGKGTGLGLSQVYGFARQSAGTVTITSAPGQGSTVTLYLPATSEPVPSQAPRQTARTGETGNRRVLVVEDNDDVAEVCCGFLSEMGYSVERVSDGRSGLDAVQSGGRYDLVLSDVIMPGGLSGIELARALKQLHPELPVVLTTGYAAGADEALRDGMMPLRKPYDRIQLAETVEAAIAARWTVE